MNLLLLLAHSIEEYDQVRLLSSLGYDVFSIGAYTDPLNPGDDKRPAILDAPRHPELEAYVNAADTMATKDRLPGELIDWADAIIVHHFPERWIAGQWDAIGRKRVIWRTVGQSSPATEMVMGTLPHRGRLEIIRYSPAERDAFLRMGVYAGEDATIRFYKDPDEWTDWRGDREVVGNVTQDMAKRAEACGLRYWMTATRGLPALPAGPGSGALRGVGELDYEAMREYLRSIRAYLYTGTRPASYTLGLIEAMMTGVPVVSIGPQAFGIPDIFEGHTITGWWFDDPEKAGRALARLLESTDVAQERSGVVRARAIDLFGRDAIAAQWRAYLGEP